LNRKILLHYCPKQFVLIELENLWTVEPNAFSTGAVSIKEKLGAIKVIFLYNEILSVCLF